MILEKLAKKKLIHPPDWLINNICFLAQGGSHSYGCNTNSSDWDYSGIVFPRKEMIFPHISGYIQGFGTQPQKFNQFSASGIKDTDSGRTYDINVYGIVNFFELAREGNPNILDIIFTSQVCITYTTQPGNLIRENRHQFLSKQSLARFRGYSFSMVKKAKAAIDDPIVKSFMELENKSGIPHSIRLEDVEKEKITRNSVDGLSHLSDNELNLYIEKYRSCLNLSKRFEDRKVHDQDTKYLYHLCRLLNQCEQVLTKHDMDLQENREQYKAIRRGEWTIDQIIQHFNDKERQLEELHAKSTLRDVCDEKKLKQLLLECIEIHYGDLSKCLSVPNEEKNILNEIALSIDRARARNLI